MIDDDPPAAPTPCTDDDDAQVRGIAALGDALRRRLYRFVVAQPGPVGRDEVAAATGVARHTAKFHLDRLAADGLLVVEYARPPGRRGPGAGRPAKLYRRSPQHLSISLPQREYELAGRLLADAIAAAGRDDVAIGDALAEGARQAGRSLGARAREQAATTMPAGLRQAATAALERAGYEPRLVGSTITLVNCPFHALAEAHPDLVCGMNLDLLSGFVDALGARDIEARLEPTPGACCVRLCDTAA